MKRWIAGFEVGSLVILPSDAAPLTYDAPGGVQIRIANGEPSASQEVRLQVHVIMESEDIFTARRETDAQLNVFLRLLSFVTSTPFKIERRTFVMDWSPAIKMREAHVWAPFPDEPQLEALEGELLETAKTLHPWSGSAVCQSALRWFGSAVRARNIEDQFQYFWFVLELIAQATVPKDRVANKCHTCGGDLFCRTCNDVPIHRPFVGQQIASLMQTLKVDAAVAERLRKVRNMLMHGSTREEIEAALLKMMPLVSPHADPGENQEGPLAAHVDIIGGVARDAVLRSFDYPPGIRFRPLFLQVKSFVHRRIEAIADMGLGLLGDGDEPIIENIRLPQVTLEYVRHEGPAANPTG